DGRVGIGPVPAPGAPEGLGAGVFWAPAAHGWARTTVESRIRVETSGSRTAPRTRPHTPAAAHRRNRRQTLFQLPNRPGRSRHGLPVRATQRTAARNRRSSALGPRAGRRSLTRSQSAVLI